MLQGEVSYTWGPPQPGHLPCGSCSAQGQALKPIGPQGGGASSPAPRPPAPDLNSPVSDPGRPLQSSGATSKQLPSLRLHPSDRMGRGQSGGAVGTRLGPCALLKACREDPPDVMGSAPPTGGNGDTDAPGTGGRGGASSDTEGKHYDGQRGPKQRSHHTEVTRHESIGRWGSRC